MDLIVNPARDMWRDLAKRNTPDDPQVAASVASIIDEVRRRGDDALRDMARRFDGAELTDLRLSQNEIDEAVAKVSPDVRDAIDKAAANIAAFHRAQVHSDVEVETTPGVKCVQRAVPIQRVGLYIPGGRAPLFSTVLMLAIPAKIAGCPEVILCTPQSGAHYIAPEIIYAAVNCGVTDIFRVGGAQAIAAMAYGTDSIRPVHKIFGPGNRYVTKAKQAVTAVTAIDMPAGPSEVLVMADATADPSFVAADMLSQAEHGPDSQAILVTDSPTMAADVTRRIDLLRAKLSRTESIERSLGHSRILVFDCVDDMVDFVNEYAPEHLIISMSNPWAVASRITAAGSVFIGNFSPESAGDYASGTNHTLPTSGWARAFSGVNIDSYTRKITYQELTRAGLESLAGTITAMARAEGLDAHAEAVRVRTQKIQ